MKRRVNKKFTYCLAIVIFFMHQLARAQTMFNEGIITYHVRQELFSRNKPIVFDFTQVIVVKGALMKITTIFKRDSSITIIDEHNNIVYDLTNESGKKIARKYSTDNYFSSQKINEDYTISNDTGGKKINGIYAQKAMVSYKYGRRRIVYYSLQWRSAHKYMFDDYPGIGRLLLEFDTSNEESRIHYTVQEIKPQNIADDCFSLPQKYTIAPAIK